MPDPRVLVVTADFSLLEAASAALSKTSGVHSAFSHVDALNALRKGQFDALVVDAALHDRISGERTFNVLGRQDNCPPLVVQLTEDDGPPMAGDRFITIAHGDNRALRHALRRALGLVDTETGELAVAVSDGPSAAVWRSEEVETFFTLSRSLTEVLDLSEVLNRVVEAARSLTNAEQGMILLPDGDANQLYLRAKVGIDVETARNFRVKTQDTLAGMAFERGEPVMIGARGPQKVKTEYFVNALLYVPILLKGKPIGVLGVSNRSSNDTFELRDQELLLHLASYAAIAIENARVHGQSIKRARELKALVDASEEINATLMLDRTLLTVCSQTMRLLGARQAEIAEYDPATRQLSTLARHRRVLFPRDREPRLRQRAVPGLLKACKSRSVVRLDRENADSETASFLDQMAASSLIVVPLASSAQVIGALLCTAVHPPQVTTEDAVVRVRQLGLEMLMAFAQEGERAQRQVFAFADEINLQFETSWVQFLLLEGDNARMLLDSGSTVWLQSALPILDLSRSPETAAALQQAVPMTLTRDAGREQWARPLLEVSDMQALLCLPVTMRGQTNGFILVGDVDTDRMFTDREVDLGRALAGQAGTAIENARLLHDLEYSLRELKGTQARLIQAERLSAMGELAATVAHQINNPLTTIIVDTELLLEGDDIAAPMHDSLESILRAGKRAKGVVRRLLTTARTSSAHEALEPVQLINTIEDTLALVRPHFARKHIQIDTTFPEHLLPAVLAPPGELDDVWLNLLLNAHDAIMGREDARIILEVVHVPGEPVISVYVRDNGMGVAPELMEDIFKPFFTTKPVGEGTGLGLHFCLQVIERVGGTIGVESRLGVGTLFTVKLPAVMKDEAL
ncbi:MAG TPA: GAF domain-containing protein [Candidatus Limnocylindrales bacterium]|nr:GAF domain-containing protein [Candidatus Limnocylindrales bacterium]